MNRSLHLRHVRQARITGKEGEQDRYRGKQSLTFDIESQRVALCFTLTVECGATIASGAVSSDTLEYQALIGDDDPH